MPAMHIREFKSGDEVALREVFFSAIHGTAAANYNPVQLDAWAPATYDTEQWARRMQGIAPFVAEERGRIVGYADVQEDGYIDHFFVAATAARQGVGSALMARIHAKAATRGLALLHAQVSLTARPFFERWGFTVDAQQTTSVGAVTFINFRMSKRLPEPGQATSATQQ